MASASACNVAWFRRDLRLEDNPAFLAAATAPGTILPIFIWCPAEEGDFQLGRASRWWLKQSLIHLNASLQSLGTHLLVQKGHDSLSVLLQIAKATGATSVFCNHLFDPVSVLRDQRVKKGLLEHGIIVHTFNSDTLYEPWEIYDEQGRIFNTFTEFWNRCLSMPFEPETPALPPKRLASYSGALPSSCSIEELGLEDEIEKSSNELLARTWRPGWANANRSLQAFLGGPFAAYATSRKNIASSISTSHFSPYLHFGELSIRTLFRSIRLKQVQEDHLSYPSTNATAFLRAIGLREYSRYVSFHFPFTQERTSLRNFPWRRDAGCFKAWKQGRTGYPLVDAAMRELWATGWLHFKLRVVASSFLVKFLQLPWTWGMKYFWDTLLDADLESDVLGWKFVSGCLTDGHEIQRLMDPHEEGCKLDPDGEYVRRWLPELSRLPNQWIQHPCNAPFHILQAAGIELGSNYPRPIIDIMVARHRLQRALQDMWAKDAAEQAARAEEMQEGQGETMETATLLRRNTERSYDQLVPSVACLYSFIRCL